MSCPAGHQEWTFQLRVDGGATPLELVFCMRFMGTDVSGTVINPLPTPVEISSLTGRRAPGGGASGREIISLEFVWDKVAIFMGGFIFAAGTERFVGRFRVFDHIRDLKAAQATAAEGEDAETRDITLLQIPPESGETGTGNGQQT